MRARRVPMAWHSTTSTPIGLHVRRHPPAPPRSSAARASDRAWRSAQCPGLLLEHSAVIAVGAGLLLRELTSATMSAASANFLVHVAQRPRPGRFGSGAASQPCHTNRFDEPDPLFLVGQFSGKTGNFVSDTAANPRPLVWRNFRRFIFCPFVLFFECLLSSSLRLQIRLQKVEFCGALFARLVEAEDAPAPQPPVLRLRKRRAPGLANP